LSTLIGTLMLVTWPAAFETEHVSTFCGVSLEIVSTALQSAFVTVASQVHRIVTSVVYQPVQSAGAGLHAKLSWGPAASAPDRDEAPGAATSAKRLAASNTRTGPALTRRTPYTRL
jgi:hypothetical protein